MEIVFKLLLVSNYMLYFIKSIESTILSVDKDLFEKSAPSYTIPFKASIIQCFMKGKNDFSGFEYDEVYNFFNFLDMKYKKTGHEDIVSCVVSKNIKGIYTGIKEGYINNTNKYGWTPLTAAVKEGDFNIVKILLENGANIDTHIYGDNILNYLVKKEYIDIIELFIKYGADVNSINSNGLKHLMITNNNDLKNLLQKNGANTFSIQNTINECPVSKRPEYNRNTINEHHLIEIIRESNTDISNIINKISCYSGDITSKYNGENYNAEKIIANVMKNKLNYLLRNNKEYSSINNDDIDLEFLLKL